MWVMIHKLGSAPYFYQWARKLIPWFAWTSGLLMVAGLIGGLVLAPPDYQQGDGFRILYVHVPAAWMSLFVYVAMAAASAVALIWRIKLAEVFLVASAPIGASFTALTLAAGSLWGEPMWGTWWVWDARLTSELILLFLYLGTIALYNAIDDVRSASRACAVLTLVGVVDIPIIHYSVKWWNTLHQGASLTFDSSNIAKSMLIPLFVMSVAFMIFYGAVVLMRMRNEILWRERHSRWVAKLISP
ncbi:heme ABC transporter permease [Salinisphaera sp. SWV1]|uniref:heme ABC transporter permease n=1 Tax=Salinisphaera sp. SWV1 TaxID=3454139 RepID=UPI003F87F28C